MLATMRDYTHHSWLIGAESFDTIASYSPEAAIRLRLEAENVGLRLITEEVELPYYLFFGAMPPSHREFFETLEFYHCSDDVICVHAGVDLDGGSLEKTKKRSFTWGPDGFPEQYTGTKKIVYGHKNNYEQNDQGWPRPRVHNNQTFGIDTISAGVLTALRFPDLRVYQSRRFKE